MKRYERYKDSGVKWLGEIPGHWEVTCLRRLLKRYSVKGHPNKPLLSVTREKGVILRGAKGDDGNNNIIPEDLSGYKHVKKGQFVINKMKSWQGSYGVSDFEGIVSPAYFVYDLDIADKRFFSWAIRSKNYVPFFMQYSKGIRVDQWDLTPENVKSIPFFIPPKSEQTAIANYLDSVTSKIDEAISQQQKMIDLLNERKQIIIQNAVTKGLDPNAKMKDSGVEWIGEIPEDWEVLKLRRISKIFTGKTPSTSNPRYFHSEDIEWFTPGDFNGIELKSSKRKISNYAIKDNASILYPKHSIFIIGIGGTIGKVAFCDLEASCNQQINVIILNENANYRYITYLLQNSNSEIMKNANLSTLPIINQQKTGDLKIILPNINEQSLIVDYINNEIKPIDSSISQCNKMISLLQERKQIIINDVVTGKVKVI